VTAIPGRMGHPGILAGRRRSLEAFIRRPHVGAA